MDKETVKFSTSVPGYMSKGISPITFDEDIDLEKGVSNA